MAKCDKKSALKIIIGAAKAYDLKMNNKHFLIVYRDRAMIKTACVGFRDMNFMHLTGVQTNLSAQQFYSACLSGKLSEKDFELDHKGKVQQKLIALPYLADLLYNPCMIGNFINSGIYIKADYFIGNTKAVLSVGFKTGKYTDYPVTLYREDIRHLSQPTNKVHAIFVKNFKEDFYSKCAYLSKGQEINSLLIAENIRKLIIKDGCSFGTSAAEFRSLS